MHPVTPVAAHWLTTVQIGITVSSGADDAAEMVEWSCFVQLSNLEQVHPHLYKAENDEPLLLCSPSPGTGTSIRKTGMEAELESHG
ncbi:hypothetical protein F4815DRAFT_443476 [Daldinia loculata]|nr:hypothetical protein F4815DRAFT_443476 [Daldinia loculata]